MAVLLFSQQRACGVQPDQKARGWNKGLARAGRLPSRASLIFDMPAPNDTCQIYHYSPA